VKQAKEYEKQCREEMDKLMDQIGPVFATISGREQAKKYILGLMSPIERKNGWQMAESLGQKTPYAIQQFLYRGQWSADQLRDCMRTYVKEGLGDPEAVLVVDETGFLKQGKKSCGVMRQYSGTAGRVENCQVGVFLTYTSSQGFTMLDRRLYLPKEWAEDKQRCLAAGVPEEVEFQTKPQIALEMIQEAVKAGVPFTWVTGDSIYGDFRDIRMWLESEGKQYVLCVSGKEDVWRGLKQHRVSRLLEGLPEEGWIRDSAGEGSKGERLYDWMLLHLNPPPWKGGHGICLCAAPLTNPTYCVHTYVVRRRIPPCKP
jgi:SRSO17 transposase